jgi:hypothetical protein
MKLLCVYDDFAYGNSPRYGSVVTVSKIWHSPAMPDGVSAYSLEEFPQPWPYRFGAWRCYPGKDPVPNFMPIEEQELQESDMVEVGNYSECL